MKITVIIIAILITIFLFWFVGGIHLKELRVIGMEKAQEICGQDAEIIYQGYERSIFIGGFGGRVWYQCKVSNDIWYQFAITRRINSSEPQVYSFKQKTIFPSNFNIN